MELRKAGENDLPQLKSVFSEIVRRMDEDGISIWNELYPSSYFEEDIGLGRLYVLTDNDVIAAAFALCGEADGADSVTWKDMNATVLYFDRLGVNTAYRHRGVARLALVKAAELAAAAGAEYLRLFVVDVNAPAIELYERAGMTRADGVYEERCDDVVLREYGYEMKTGK